MRPSLATMTTRGWRQFKRYDRTTLVEWSVVCIFGLLLGTYVVGLAALVSRLLILGSAVLILLCLGLASGHILRLMLLLVILDTTFPIDAFVNYRENVALFGAIGGWNVSITTVMLVGMYLIWICRLLIKIAPPLHFTPRISLYLLLYVGTIVLSILSARDVELALFEVFMLAQPLLVYGYVMNFTRNEQDVKFIVMMLIASLAIEGLVMIALRVVGNSITIGGLQARIDPDGRVGGTIGSPNGAASCLTLMLVLSFSVLLTNWRRRERCLAMCAFVLGTAGLLLTQSRGSLVAYGLALSIICIATVWRGLMSPLFPLLGIFSAIVLFVFLRDSLLARLINDDGGSAHSRIPLMILAFKMICDHPLLGVGANNFAAVILDYATPEFDRGWIYIVHNNYLLIWAEKGIIGLIAFVTFLCVLVKEGWRHWKRANPALAPLALGCSASIFSQALHMNLDVFNGRSYIQLLLLITGLLAAFNHMNDMTTREA